MKRPADSLSLLLLWLATCTAPAIQPLLIAELPDPLGYSGNYGTSLAVENGVALVGASFYLQTTGKAFLLNATSGELLSHLSSPEGLDEGWFGHDVAMDGGLALVGSPGGDETAAYLYDAATGNLLFKLTPDGPDSTGPLNQFGYTVAIHGQRALVGDRRGGAYLFDVRTGAQIASFIPAGATIIHQQIQSVALDDQYALIGTPFTSSNEPGGAAHLFDLQTHSEIAEYRKPDAPRLGEYGREVAIDGGVAAIASSARLNGEQTNRPFAPVQLIDVVTGDTIAELSPDTTPPINGYGWSIAMDKGIVAVGSPAESESGGIDSVYLFDAASGERLGVIPSPLPGVSFGYDVAIDGDLVLTASPGTRSVLVYRLVPEPATAWLLVTATLAGLRRRR